MGVGRIFYFKPLIIYLNENIELPSNLDSVNSSYVFICLNHSIMR